MIDSKQYFSPWQVGMPALVKVEGEFRICPTYRLITEKYTDIRRRMAEKEGKGYVVACALGMYLLGGW